MTDLHPDPTSATPARGSAMDASPTRSRHEPWPDVLDHCRLDDQIWPCDAIREADEKDALSERLTSADKRADAAEAALAEKEEEARIFWRQAKKARADLDALLANGPDVRIWLEYRRERDAETARADKAEAALAAAAPMTRILADEMERQRDAARADASRWAADSTKMQNERDAVYADWRKMSDLASAALADAEALAHAATVMPDAGLAEGDPRYEWWHEVMAPALRVHRHLAAPR